MADAGELHAEGAAVVEAVAGLAVSDASQQARSVGEGVRGACVGLARAGSRGGDGRE